MTLAFFSGPPGILEIVIVLVIILVLFGSKKLPEFSRSIGRSLGEFKKGRKEGEQALADLKKEMADQEELDEKTESADQAKIAEENKPESSDSTKKEA